MGLLTASPLVLEVTCVTSFCWLEMVEATSRVGYRLVLSPAKIHMFQSLWSRKSAAKCDISAQKDVKNMVSSRYSLYKVLFRHDPHADPRKDDPRRRRVIGEGQI